MLGAMAGWFSFIAFSNDAIVSWTGSFFRKISVEAHQIMTSRSSLCAFLKFRMSSMRRRA